MDTSLDLNGDSFVLGIPFTKVDAEKRTVEGFATLDNVDKAGDLLDAEASKEAFSEWVGNIREMHQKKAVGKAIKYTEKQYKADNGETYDGIWLKARVSDGAEDTWQKVLDGTLRGFSVGGAVKEKEREMAKDLTGTEVPVWRVTKYSLGEVSLVDSMCNTLASIDIIKSIDGALEIQDVIDDGELEKATNSGNQMRPTMKPTKPMQPKQDTTVEPATPDDDDLPYIKKILAALQSWREEEVKDGDDHDLAFISTIIQQLKERVHAGDPGIYGDDKAVFGAPDTEPDPAPIKKFAKDADNDTDMPSDQDADDETTHAPVAYPAQHLLEAKNHLAHAHKHAAKKGHMGLASDAHYTMQKVDSMYKDACSMEGMTGGTAMNKYDDLTKLDELTKAASLTPYGNVDYADPGYQSDKKKRYPINTPEHVKAALGYIEHPDNSALYTPEHLAEIKDKINAAAKRFGKVQKLHNNEEYDISDVVDKLSGDNKGIIRKFANFLFNSKIANCEEQVVKEGDNTEMDKELLEKTISEAVESLTKSVDGKFDQVGESLTKVATALESLVTVDALNDLKKGFEDAVVALAERVVTLESSGAIQKSADNDGKEETLEKQDAGFWAGSLVPEFLQQKYRGR